MEYGNSEIVVICPVCENKECQCLYSVTSEMAAQHFVLKEVSPERYFKLVECIRTLWGRNDCSVVRCLHCNFTFAFPFIGGDEDVTE